MHKIDFEEFRNDIPSVPIKCNLCNEEIKSNYAEHDVSSIQCPKTSQTEFRIITANDDVCTFVCKDVKPEQLKEYEGVFNKGKKPYSIENKYGHKANSFNFGLVDVNTKQTKKYFVKNNLNTLNLWVFGFESESKELTIKIPLKLIEPGKREAVEVTWSPKILNESGQYNKRDLDSGHSLMIYPVPTKTAPELKPLYPKKVWVSA